MSPGELKIRGTVFLGVVSIDLRRAPSYHGGLARSPTTLRQAQGGEKPEVGVKLQEARRGRAFNFMRAVVVKYNRREFLRVVGAGAGDC